MVVAVPADGVDPTVLFESIVVVEFVEAPLSSWDAAVCPETSIGVTSPSFPVDDMIVIPIN